MTDHWSNWIRHDGSTCPVWPGYIVEVDLAPDAYVVTDEGEKTRYAFIVTRENEGWEGWADVCWFRIRWPRGMKVLYDLLENLPERVE